MKFRIIVGLFLANLISIVVAVNSFTIDNLVSWPHPQSITLSPDKKLGFYFTTSYDISNKKTSVNGFILKFPESGTRDTSTLYNVTKLFSSFADWIKRPLQMTWLEKDSLIFIMQDQLWTMALPDDLSNIEHDPTLFTPPSSISLFNGTKKVSSLSYHFESQTIIFSAVVKAPSNQQDFGDSGLVYDQLFVRHWDQFINPLEKKQLFYAKLTKSSDKKSNWVISDGPYNLLRNTELESPPFVHGDESDYCLSPDGKELAFVSKPPGHDQAWSTKADIFIVSTEQYAKPKSLTRGNLGASSKPKYSPDGKYLAWLQMKTSKYESDKKRIILYERSSGKAKELVSWWDRSPSTIEWSGGSDKIIIIAEEYGHKRVFYVTPSSDHVQQVTEHGSANQLTLIRDNIFITTFSGLASPPEFYTMEVENKFKVTRQTNINYERVKDYSLSDPEDFWFKGSDDHNVHGFVLRPPNFNSRQNYPLILLIHGGPHEAWTDQWVNFWNLNLFANAGYFVVAINPHGSSGYGQNFTDSTRFDWGGKPFRDIMLGLDYVLKEYKNIDQQRVCALGLSYGGYMINWINGHSNRFKCLVNHDGAFDVKNTYYTTDELYFMEHEFGGTPYENPDLFEKFSPSSYVSNWSTPTMIIHSAKDYRFVDGEGLATFTALQRRGIQSRLLYFPDENHLINKESSSLRWYYEVFRWFDQFCHPNLPSMVNETKYLFNNTTDALQIKPT